MGPTQASFKQRTEQSVVRPASILLFTLTFFIVHCTLSQWSTPQLLDSIPGVRQEGAKAAISKTGTIAVVVREWGSSISPRLAVYRSDDHGRNFKRRAVLQPFAMEYQLYSPSGLAFDNNDNLWLLWNWDLWFDGFPMAFNGILCKSTDGGDSFSDILHSAGYEGWFWNMVIDGSNNVHLLQDTSYIGSFRRLAYMRLEQSNPQKIFRTLLPFIISPFIDFAVCQDSILQIVSNSAEDTGGTPSDRVKFTRSTDGGKSFTQPKFLDTISIPQQNFPKILIDEPNNTLVAYTLNDSSFNITAVQSSDMGKTFSKPFRLGIGPGGSQIILGSDSDYVYLIYYSKFGTIYEQLQKGSNATMDTANFPNMEPRDFVVREKNEKCLFMAKFVNSWGYLTYFSYKDIPVSVFRNDGSIIKDFTIANYPNPFNGSTTLFFDLPVGGRIKLRIYNIVGQLINEILTEELSPGHHRILYQPENLPSGVYILYAVMEHYNAKAKLLYVK